MKKFALSLLAVALWAVSNSNVEAQLAYVTYYRPATVYSPVMVPGPAPAYYTSYYAAPAPVAVVPAPVYQPVTRVRTRYRPFLGGTVTRVRTGYGPAYYPAPAVYAY